MQLHVLHHQLDFLNVHVHVPGIYRCTCTCICEDLFRLSYSKWIWEVSFMYMNNLYTINKYVLIFFMLHYALWGSIFYHICLQVSKYNQYLLLKAIFTSFKRHAIEVLVWAMESPTSCPAESKVHCGCWLS